MFLQLPIALLLTWSTSEVSARGSLDFTLGTRFRPAVVSKPSANRVTSNTIQLQRSHSSISQSSQYLGAIRQNNQVDGIYSRLQSGNASVLSVSGGSVFLAPITIGGQSFNVVIDTGSSDTWLVAAQYTCQNPTSGTAIPNSQCRFGPSYNLSTTAIQIPDQNFKISYGDGEFLTGLMYHENVTFAGVDVSQQEIGVVDRAAWLGDDVSSGLVGLAYPLLTNAYAGSDPTADVLGKDIIYDPLFTSMWKQSLTSAVFSLALEQSSSSSSDSSTSTSPGGVLAIGGIPPVRHGTFFASAPISIIGFQSSSDDSSNSSTQIPEYQFYNIPIDGYAISNSSAAIFDVQRTGNQRYTPILPIHSSRPLSSSSASEGADSDANPSKLNAVIDSGTTLIYIPPSIASFLASLFNPPAKISFLYGNLYLVDCDINITDTNSNTNTNSNAKSQDGGQGASTGKERNIPLFGIVIDGKTFFIKPQDLIVETDDLNICVLAVQGNDGNVGSASDSASDSASASSDSTSGSTSSGSTTATVNAGGLNILGDVFLRNVLAVFDVGAAEMRFAAR